MRFQKLSFRAVQLACVGLLSLSLFGDARAAVSAQSWDRWGQIDKDQDDFIDTLRSFVSESSESELEGIPYEEAVPLAWSYCFQKYNAIHGLSDEKVYYLINLGLILSHHSAELGDVPPQDIQKAIKQLKRFVSKKRREFGGGQKTAGQILETPRFKAVEEQVWQRVSPGVSEGAESSSTGATRDNAARQKDPAALFDSSDGDSEPFDGFSPADLDDRYVPQKRRVSTPLSDEMNDDRKSRDIRLLGGSPNKTQARRTPPKAHSAEGDRGLRGDRDLEQAIKLSLQSAKKEGISLPKAPSLNHDERAAEIYREETTRIGKIADQMNAEGIAANYQSVHRALKKRGLI